MIDYDAYTLSKREKHMVTTMTGVLLTVIGILFFKSPILLGCLPLVQKVGWRIYEDYQKEKRQKLLLREFRDFLFSLSASFATGRHMTEAMKEAEKALLSIYGEKSFFIHEIRYMVKAIEETGQNTKKVFGDFAERTGLEDIQLFSEVYGACRESGGNMAAAVNQVASLLTEKINLEMEIQTMLFQKKLEGSIIAVMPAAMIFFLLWMSPNYLAPMYSTMAGKILMALALSLNGFAYFWMEKMTDVKL